MATIWRRALAPLRGGGRVATGQPWQSPMGSLLPQNQPDRGFTPQRDFRTVHAKHARVPAWS